MNLKIFKGYERFNGEYPADAVKYALENREEAIPELLAILDYSLKDAENLSVDIGFRLHYIAIFLLAYFKEPKAFSRIIDFLKLPGDILFDFFEDIVTEDFKNILASTYNGDLTSIKKVIEDVNLDEYARCEALDSLIILMINDKLTRGDLVTYFKELLNTKLKKDDTIVWDTLFYACCNIHPLELEEDLESAINNKKINEEEIDIKLLDKKIKIKIDEAINDLKEDDTYSLIDETDIESLPDFYETSDDFDESEEDMKGLYFDEEESVEEVNIPYVRDNYVGRNDPCPCGSGKKYKKCCMK